MATWKRVGQAVNKAESRAFRYLERQLPDDYIFFSNVSIFDAQGHLWDYDVILLGRYAVYVIELKNYGGTIQGDRYSWTVLNGDAVFTPPDHDIIETVNTKARILKAKLKESSGILGRIYVHGCVCLTGHQGKIRIKDEPQRLERLRWLYGIENYLTDRYALPVPETLSVNTYDIRRDHQRIQKVVEDRKLLPLEKQEQIGEYQVLDVAWRASRYLALYASHSGKWPPKYLLKVYDIPDNATPQTTQNIIRNLNRELSALRIIREREISDPRSGAQNVIAAYETFLHPGGRHYVVVMEWVNGVLLSSKLLNPIRFTLEEKLLIAAQICRGLACAHKASVVHRNLTPENIIVDLDNIVKIINFDFAKFVPLHSSSVPIIRGSMIGFTRFLNLNYMAPELHTKSHHEANELSDIYSVGLILAEIFFDSPPILGRRTDNGQLTPADSTQVEIVEWLRELIAGMCEQDVEKRQASLYESAEQFEAIIALIKLE